MKFIQVGENLNSYIIFYESGDFALAISINIAVISRENMCYFEILRGDSTIDINPSDSLDIAR